ncbi:hypothetical protein [Leuconostoc mesenteroides]|uniref:hypothetical protein n=1 Tax=Leuconostoc mesenteroides TaxID=1245 RepID=UPI001CC01EB9|nr:hypothetical protein [Leuconostoc mesenteroides]MBZ1508858.1 hypothetical protein [Leuconostoc mesenteroides]MBZ1532776.1 hypothetical protein [Leuconostoc mesenteroides]
MRDKSILEKLKAFREFHGAIIKRYPTREGLLKFIQADGITVSWYYRGDIAVQVGDNDEIVCGIRELSDVVSEALS